MRERRIWPAFNDAGKGDGKGSTGWFRVQAAAGGSYEVSIYDRIGKDWWSGEGIAAKEFVDELKRIPLTAEITLRINSNGGNINDGMVIYNRLAERRDKVSVIVDGVAASIASVIALAGKSLEMPSNTLMMIHDPWTIAEGNAADMRRAADMLDTHRDAIVSVYAERTGKEPKVFEKMMAEETWLTAEEAVELGFATSVGKEIAFSACFDYSRFKRVPESLQKQNKQQQKGNSMNREQTMAALKARGIAFDANASTEALLALLQTQPQAGQQDLPLAPPPAPPAPPQAASQPAPPAPPQAASQPAPPAPPQAANDDIARRLADIEARYTSERRQRIAQAVDQCVAEDRIPAAQREAWVARAVADESVLNDIRMLPQRPPGAAPLRLTVEAESPQAIAREILRFRQPIEAFRRGESVESAAIASHSRAIAVAINANRQRLEQVLNTNTVAPELKRNVILADFMRAFKRRLVALQVFSTKFSNIPLQGTDKISIPFYDLDTTTSNNFAAATGYEFTHDTTTGAREITINKRKYKPLTFSSSELLRQPYFNPPANMMLMAEQLAVDVWTDVLSVVVDSNFPTEALAREPASFDVDDMARLKKAAEDADWPVAGRAAVLGTGHELGLLSDDTIKLALNSGTDQGLREGATGRIMGFELFISSRIPTNSQDLAGFICFPSAVLFASAPVAPAPGVRQQLLSYEVVTDPDTGVAFEYRYWGEAQMDKDREVVECNYGYAKGNASALQRITTGASGFSSSSSQSSVNSSSSSSSSASF